MRKARGPIIPTERRYVPDVEDDGWRNRDDPTPVTVTLTRVTEADRRNIAYAFVNYNPENPESLKRSESAKKDACARFIKKVENYRQPDGTPIATGEDFYTHGEDFIVEDVFSEIMLSLSLSEESEKKSAELPDSTSQATQASTGIAESAENQVSQPNGAATSTQPGAALSYT